MVAVAGPKPGGAEATAATPKPCGPVGVAGLDDCDDPERDVAEFVVLLREHGLLPREEHR